MAASRADVEHFILEKLHEMAPGGQTPAFYKQRFERMSDEDFKTFMADLESGKEFLVLYAPNFGNTGLSVSRNFALAKKMGHNFFQRLWIGAQGNVPAYLTPIQYLVVDLPLRRASQLLTKKIRLPEHNKTVDTLTGQPTGESRGAKISLPELQVLSAMGCDYSVVELMKYRGGDLKGHNAMNGMIARYGAANQKTLANYASGVESTRTLKTFLTSAMLKSTLP